MYGHGNQDMHAGNSWKGGKRAWKVGKIWISSHTDRMVRKHRHAVTLGSKFVQCWHHWTCFIRQHKTMGNHQPLEYPLVNIHSLLLKMAQSLNSGFSHETCWIFPSFLRSTLFFPVNLPGIFCGSVVRSDCGQYVQAGGGSCWGQLRSEEKISFEKMPKKSWNTGDIENYYYYYYYLNIIMFFEYTI